MSVFSRVDAIWKLWSQSPAAMRLGSTLLHFVWQGAALAAAAFLLLGVLKRGRPQVKYVSLLAILGAMAASPLVTWSLLPGDTAQVARARIPAAPSIPDPRTNRIRVSPIAAAPVADRAGGSRTVRPASSPVEKAMSPESAASPALSPDRVALAVRWIEELRPWFVTAWFVGVCVFFSRLAVGLIGAEWTRRRGVTRVPQSIEQIVARLSVRLRIGRTVRIFQSALAEVPTLVGWLSPVILLPASALSGLTPEQWEAVLAHELAHVRRHDYLFNLLQTLAETFLFYHPAVWWVSRRIRQEREHCCDDMAIEFCGDRAAYVQALVSLEELRAAAPPRWVVAAAGGSLVTRIRRVARAENDARPGLAVILSAAGVLALIAVAGFSSRTAETADGPKLPVKSPEPGRGAFRAELPDGAVIELLGVGECPAGKDGWWRADGLPLPKAPSKGFDKNPREQPIADSISRQFVLDLLTDQTANVSVKSFDGSLRTSSEFESTERANGHAANRVRQRQRFRVTLRPNSRTTIAVNYAADGWRTVASTDGGLAATGFNDGGIVFDEPMDEHGVARISAAYDVRDRDMRIVAVDKENHEHPTDNVSSASGRNAHLLVARFPGLSRAKIREFRFQTRAIQRVEFRNVSLHRGQKTHVQIFIDGKPATPKAVGTQEKAGGPTPLAESSGTKSAARLPAAAGPSPPVQTPASNTVRTIAGRVVDQAGNPIAAGRLWWVVLDNFDDPRAFTVEGACDADGRFRMQAPRAWKAQPPDRRPADMLWVLAPGKDLKVVRAKDALIAGEKAPEFLVRLEPATDTEFQVNDVQGRPLAGAVLEPSHFHTPRADEYLPAAIRDLLRATTDQSGRTHLRSLNRKDLSYLDVKSTAFGTQQLRLDGPDASAPLRTITLRPVGRIEGRLISDEPNAARGVKLWFESNVASRKTVPWTRPDGKAGRRTIWETVGTALVVADEQGRFVVPVIAEGRATIDFLARPDSRVLPRVPQLLTVTAGEILRLDLRMEPSVLVQGAIGTEDGAPVAGAEVEVGYGTFRQGSRVISDAAGHYEAHVLAGPAYTQVIAMPEEIRTRYEQIGEPWTKEIQVPADAKRFELPKIVLAATEITKGSLVDRDGQPVADATVSAIRGNRRYGVAKTSARGEFSLRVPKKLGIDFYEVTPRDRFVSSRATIEKYEPLIIQIDARKAAAAPSGQKKSKSPARGKIDRSRDSAVSAKIPPAAGKIADPEVKPAAAAAPDNSGGPTLAGHVVDHDGKPIAGATVMVWEAGVKQGYSTYCPGCYADCGKRTVTDGQGAFALGRLSPDLRFKLLVVKEGYSPAFVSKADPFKGLVVARLDRRQSPADPTCVVRGRVVGPAGDPLPGAVIEPEFVWFNDETGNLSGSGGAVKGLDPLAVSNEQGVFEIAYAKPAVKMTLLVKARGMAPRRFDDLSTGADRHTLALARGAGIRGRLTYLGKPVGGAEMGLVSRDRAMGQYFSEVRIGTQPDGSFLFVNVPAPGSWYVYAKMTSVARQGATLPVALLTERDGETIDAGPIEITRGHRLQGQVVLTDGKPIPEGMRIIISANKAWDSQVMPLGADGRFEFAGLPTDDYAISPAVKGYRLSEKNPNLSWTVEGLIDRDIEGFVILLDPGWETFKGRSAGKFNGKPLKSASKP